MTKPRVYADFNNWGKDQESYFVYLNCHGTKVDLARLNLELHEGLELTLYTDDADDEGKPDDLEADGIVSVDRATGLWIARIDWNAIRHSSDRNSSN